MGSEAASARYVESVRKSGSLWGKALLGRLFESLPSIPFQAKVRPRCEFLHFATS